MALARPHDDLWLSDGSVILAADDTLFKVHKSQLSRHSVIFRDMFAMPQTIIRSDLQTIDGCDVVWLHDSPQDLESLLQALYDGPSFGDNSEADFAVVSGVLRLSNKYLIEPLRRRAIAHLSLAWPTTLTSWDEREDLADRAHRERMQSPRSDGSSTPPAESTERFYPHAARVITLAREVNAPALLPAAFYDLARHSFARLLAGDASPSSSLEDIDASSDPLGLAPDDFRRLALGKEAAHNHIIALIRSMGAIRSGSSAHHHAHSHSTHGHPQFPSARASFCATPAACRKDFSELSELATQHYILDRHHGSADPLYVAEELGQLKSAELAECRACAIALESWSQRERDKIWKLIPTWFRLDSWEAMGLS
ncbi:hypothetical protein AURDEDRAFT_69110 [Auricularia subglabra TFB-10046 SS5]|nr:hypothetical protein AURDEDRAFT_69110 [Auricularia subglabra TFB-10046 SS5]